MEKHIKYLDNQVDWSIPFGVRKPEDRDRKEIYP